MSDTNTAVVAGLSTTGTGFGRTGICKVIKGPPAAALPEAPGAADCATAAPPLVASMRPLVKRTVRMSVVMLDPLLAVSVNIDRRQYRASELPSERVNRAWDMQEIQPKMRRRASSKMIGLTPMSGRAVRCSVAARTQCRRFPGRPLKPSNQLRGVGWAEHAALGGRRHFCRSGLVELMALDKVCARGSLRRFFSLRGLFS